MSLDAMIAAAIENGKAELQEENQQLKEKIEFYEAELHRRGYVIPVNKKD